MISYARKLHCKPVVGMATLCIFFIARPEPVVAEADPGSAAARQAVMAAQARQPQSRIKGSSCENTLHAIRIFRKEGNPILSRRDFRYRELTALCSQQLLESPSNFMEAWRQIADTNTPPEWRSIVIDCSPVLLSIISVTRKDSLNCLASVIGSGAEPIVKSAAICASEAIVAQTFTNPDSDQEHKNAVYRIILNTCATLTETVKQLEGTKAEPQIKQTDLLVSGLSSLTRILRHTQCDRDQIRLEVASWGTNYRYFDFESSLCFLRLLKFGLYVIPDDSMYSHARSLAKTQFDKELVKMLQNSDLPSTGEQEKR